MAIEQLCDDDSALLERIQRGDDQAIALLFDRYSTIVYSVALRVLCDPALAEQVLSDIFIEIWRGPKRFMQITDSFSPSMAMIARNRAVAMLLHKPASDFLPGHGVVNRQELNMTHDEACSAIDQLPKERRIMLESAFFPGLTQSPSTSLPLSPLETDEYMDEHRDEHRAVSEAVARLSGTGLEVIDIESDPAFARRQLHARDVVSHIQGMNRLARVFVESPTTILRELVNAAVDLCGADSAGISIEQKDGTEENFYHWAATAGQYSSFLDAKLPRYPSACGVTLERGRPQVFRVSQRFFDLMGIQAPTVTDGLLLPWQTNETRGTIWIMAHGRQEAFDGEDCRMMQALANFAATGVRLQQQHKQLMQQAKTEAEAAMANKLAHQINNPLQGLMQTVFLFDQEISEPSAFTQQAMREISRLSDLIKELLAPAD